MMKVYSIQRRIISWSIRLGVISVGIYGLTYYSENPTGLLILFIVCIGIASLVKDEEIEVFDDHLSHNQLFVGGIYKRKKKYLFEGIETCSIHNDNNSMQNIANEIIERQLPDRFNYLEISYSNMKKISIKTNIDIISLRKVNKEINKIFLPKKSK